MTFDSKAYAAVVEHLRQVAAKPYEATEAEVAEHLRLYWHDLKYHPAERHEAIKRIVASDIVEHKRWRATWRASVYLAWTKFLAEQADPRLAPLPDDATDSQLRDAAEYASRTRYQQLVDSGEVQRQRENMARQKMEHTTEVDAEIDKVKLAYQTAFATGPKEGLRAAAEHIVALTKRDSKLAEDCAWRTMAFIARCNWPERTVVAIGTAAGLAHGRAAVWVRAKLFSGA